MRDVCNTLRKSQEKLKREETFSNKVFSHVMNKSFTNLDTNPRTNIETVQVGSTNVTGTRMIELNRLENITDEKMD